MGGFVIKVYYVYLDVFGVYLANTCITGVFECILSHEVNATFIALYLTCIVKKILEYITIQSSIHCRYMFNTCIEPNTCTTDPIHEIHVRIHLQYIVNTCILCTSVVTR